MKRFNRCPVCCGLDIEILTTSWVCWDCNWEEGLNEDEREQKHLENLGLHND